MMVVRADSLLAYQAFACEPLLDQGGDFEVVLVHHQHVRIALDAGLGQLDHVDLAAGRGDFRGEVEAVLVHFRPARIALDEVAVDEQHRNVLERAGLQRIGEGRGLLFTSGFDNLGNDFPLHPAFVAFVDQAARYLSGAERRSVARQVDSYLDLRTAREGEAASTSGVEIVDPEGRRPLSLREAATAQSFKLSEAGFYQVRLASGRQDVVGVNPDRRESNLDVIPADVLALWQGKGPRTPPSAVAVPASEGTQPYPLWWYIMAFALLAALSESWLASRYLGTPHEES